MTRSTVRLIALGLTALVGLAGPMGCGGKAAATAGAPKPEIDRDPIAMLAPSAVLVARADLRAVYGDPSLGGQVAAITDGLLPIGDGTWFLASRDVDGVLVAVYATPGTEIAAVLTGHFDVDRIAHATQTTSGAPVTIGAYAGFTTSTFGRVTWVALTPKMLVAGSSEGIRFVLDRLQRGAPERSLPPWIIQTLETPGASGALAADFVSQPVPAATLASVNLPWLKGLRIARVITDMLPPGINVAGTLTYADPSEAQEAAGALRSADRWLELLGPLVGGVKLQGFDANSEGDDVRCKFAADAQGLHAILSMVPRLTRPSPTR